MSSRHWRSRILLSFLAFAFVVRGLLPIHGDLHIASHLMADHFRGHADLELDHEHSGVHGVTRSGAETSNDHPHGQDDASLVEASEHAPSLAGEHLEPAEESGHQDGLHSLMHIPGAAQMFFAGMHDVQVPRVECDAGQLTHLAIPAALGGRSEGVFRPPIDA